MLTEQWTSVLRSSLLFYGHAVILCHRWGTHNPKWLMDAGTVMVMGMPTAPPMVHLQRLQPTWVQKPS
jgi:hypothetical protein